MRIPKRELKVRPESFLDKLVSSLFGIPKRELKVDYIVFYNKVYEMMNPEKGVESLILSTLSYFVNYESRKGS